MERKRQLAAIPATWRQQPHVGGARSPQAHQGWSSSRGRRLLCATLSAAYGARLPCGKDVRPAPGVAAVRSTLPRVRAPAAPRMPDGVRRVTRVAYCVPALPRVARAAVRAGSCRGNRWRSEVGCLGRKQHPGVTAS